VVLVNFLGQKRRSLIGLLQVAAEFLALATGVLYCQPENDTNTQDIRNPMRGRKRNKIRQKRKGKTKQERNWKYVGV
jgi:hypothetical protein